jgi:hypothetical protein
MIYHKILYYFWRTLVFIIGIDLGTKVKIYSKEKKRRINGTVTELTWDALSKYRIGCRIGITWQEPLYGNEPNFYMWGSYSLRDFIKSNIEY